jgi:hypothetical protein
VAGLGKGEARLPALNQETIGERHGAIGPTGAGLGPQGLQFGGVLRGLRPVE